MNLLTDIFRASAPDKVEAKPLRDVYAQTEVSFHKVEIDLKTNVNPAKKYLHERIHQVRPAWSEAEVSKHENALWKRLTHKQVEKLFRQMFP